MIKTIKPNPQPYTSESAAWFSSRWSALLAGSLEKYEKIEKNCVLILNNYYREPYLIVCNKKKPYRRRQLPCIHQGPRWHLIKFFPA